MKKIFFVCYFLLISITFYGQVNTQFPNLTGKTLSDKTINIPTDTKGKYTIICISHSQKSSEAIKNWMQPMYTAFLDDSEYDTYIYFIGMIAGIKELMGSTIEKKMKETIDPELQPYVLLYRGNVGDYKQSLSMPDKESPYFFVLDKQGKIVYKTSGAYTDDKLDAIENSIK